MTDEIVTALRAMTPGRPISEAMLRHLMDKPADVAMALVDVDPEGKPVRSHLHHKDFDPMLTWIERYVGSGEFRITATFQDGSRVKIHSKTGQELIADWIDHQHSKQVPLHRSAILRAEASTDPSDRLDRETPKGQKGMSNIDLVERLRKEGKPEDFHNSVGTMGFGQDARSALMREAAEEIALLRVKLSAFTAEKGADTAAQSRAAEARAPNREAAPSLEEAKNRAHQAANAEWEASAESMFEQAVDKALDAFISTMPFPLPASQP